MVREIGERVILHWNYRGLSTLPVELLEFGDHLHEIYLKQNLISELPHDLHKLRNLTNLYLQANRLTSLPNSIGSLTLLEALDISQNNLTSLPDGVGKLLNLKRLILTNNAIATIPESVGNLGCLESLQISCNQLRKLTSSLANCARLEELHADQNFLTELPFTLAFLPRLKSISVCSNQLRYLPPGPFLSLKTFYFDNNPGVNYIPAMLANRLGPSKLRFYKCHGRDFPYEKCTGTLIKVSLPSETVRLQVYQQLDHISQPSLHCMVPTLLELSLRYIAFSDFQYVTDHLPEILGKHIEQGPLTLCCHCAKPIFTHASLNFSCLPLETERDQIILAYLTCTCSCMVDFLRMNSTIKRFNWQYE